MPAITIGQRQVRSLELVDGLPVATESGVFFVLSGGVEWGGQKIMPGCAALFGKGTVVPKATTPRTHIGLLIWDVPSLAAGPFVVSPAGTHYTRLQSYLSPVTFGEFDAAVRPWSLYSVVLDPVTDHRVALHEHRRVTNALLIRGPVGEQVGHLLARPTVLSRASYPIRGGDLIVVRPGVPHAVLPTPGATLEMFVLNDSAAEYEDEKHADFYPLGDETIHHFPVRKYEATPTGLLVVE